MAFKSAFIAHTPNANPEEHKCSIQTDKYKLFVRLVQRQEQAVDVANSLVKNEGIHSILLCPGFTNEEVAEISESVGENVGVSVARGDSPSSKIAKEVMEKEGWFE